MIVTFPCLAGSFTRPLWDLLLRLQHLHDDQPDQPVSFDLSHSIFFWLCKHRAYEEQWLRMSRHCAGTSPLGFQKWTILLLCPPAFP